MPRNLRNQNDEAIYYDNTDRDVLEKYLSGLNLNLQELDISTINDECQKFADKSMPYSNDMADVQERGYYARIFLLNIIEKLQNNIKKEN